MHLLNYFILLVKSFEEKIEEPEKLMDLVAEALSEKQLYGFKFEQVEGYRNLTSLVKKIGFVDDHGYKLEISSKGRKFLNLYENIFGNFMNYEIPDQDELDPSDSFEL